MRSVNGGGIMYRRGGKEIVLGIKDRKTNRIVAVVVPDAKRETLQPLVKAHLGPETKVYTDEAKAYKGLKGRKSVKHYMRQYAVGEVHVNGIEGFWSKFKRGYHGTFHSISPQHLHRYLDEFTGRHNIRDKDTLRQMRKVVAGMIGKRLLYRELTGRVD